MAKVWVQGVQRKYAKILQMLKVSECFYKKDLESGWERKKDRQTCHFCDAHVHEYSYRCPLGGAVACRGCKNAIASSSLKESFAYVNTHAGAKKGKGKKKAKKTKVQNAQESESDQTSKTGRRTSKTGMRRQNMQRARRRRQSKSQHANRVKRLRGPKKKKPHDKRQMLRSLQERRPLLTRLLIKLLSQERPFGQKSWKKKRPRESHA
jgi:hypothetical protein